MLKVTDWLPAITITIQAGIGSQQAKPVPAPSIPARAPNNDIIVEGIREIEVPNSAVTRKTLGSGRNGAGAIASLEVLDLAQRFAQCAINDTADTRRDLRRALDGTINGAEQRFAQEWFIRKRSACAQDAEIARAYGIAVISTKYDTSYYARGALFVEAIQHFAPDLKLSAQQTANPQVQANFNTREIPLARFRLPADRRYFEMAVCLVRLQPDLSVRLVRTSDARTISLIEAAIVNRARVCVGNARKVYFDPAQFRI